jgi:hypothetical protein
MPYSVGLQAAAAALLGAGVPVIFTTAIIIFLLIVSIASSFQKDSVDTPASLPVQSLFAIMPFFRRRYDFLNWGFQASGHSIFQFNLLRVSTLRFSQ